MDFVITSYLFPTPVGNLFFEFKKLFFENLLTKWERWDIIYTSKENVKPKKKRREEENMEIMYQINNYQLGAKLKSCPLEKILKQERKDSKHTEVWFANLTKNEQQLVNKLLGKPKFISAE